MPLFWEAEALPKTQRGHLLYTMTEEPGISNFLGLAATYILVVIVTGVMPENGSLFLAAVYLFSAISVFYTITSSSIAASLFYYT